MLFPKPKSEWIGLTLAAALLAGTSSGCNDEETTPSAPTTPGVPSAQPSSLRVANLTADARTVDVAVNGRVLFRGVPYPGVSEYTNLEAGPYRIQFLPTGQLTPSLVETTMTLGAGEIVTAAAVGIGTLEIQAIRDHRSGAGTRAGLKLYNAVPDYPASFDAAVENGDVLHRGIGYRQASGYAELVPGIYSFELRRGGTREVVATSEGRPLLQGSNYTAFAVGAFRREDIELFLAPDGG